jgi:hypothetical protein
MPEPLLFPAKGEHKGGTLLLSHRLSFPRVLTSEPDSRQYGNVTLASTADIEISHVNSSDID